MAGTDETGGVFTAAIAGRLGEIAERLARLQGDALRLARRTAGTGGEPSPEGDAAGRFLGELELIRYAVLNARSALAGTLPETPDRAELNPMEIIGSLLPLLAGPAAEAGVEIRFDPDGRRERVPAIWLDAASYRRAAHNVLMRAIRRSAPEGGGEVTIRCRYSYPLAPPPPFSTLAVGVTHCEEAADAPEGSGPTGAAGANLTEAFATGREGPSETEQSPDLELAEARRCLEAQGGELLLACERSPDGRLRRVTTTLALHPEDTQQGE